MQAAARHNTPADIWFYAACEVNNKSPANDIQYRVTATGMRTFSSAEAERERKQRALDALVPQGGAAAEGNAGGQLQLGEGGHVHQAAAHAVAAQAAPLAPKNSEKKSISTVDRWAGKILAGTVGLDIRSGVPGNWNAAQKFKPLSDDAALAWCRYLGLRRGDKNEKLEVLGQWFEQRPALGKIYRVTPERGCPCTDCVPTAEWVTQDMQDSLFSKKVGGDHELVRPPHRT